jgi:hypothetical protein
VFFIGRRAASLSALDPNELLDPFEILFRLHLAIAGDLPSEQQAGW